MTEADIMIRRDQFTVALDNLINQYKDLYSLKTTTDNGWIIEPVHKVSDEEVNDLRFFRGLEGKTIRSRFNKYNMYLLPEARYILPGKDMYKRPKTMWFTKRAKMMSKIRDNYGDFEYIELGYSPEDFNEMWEIVEDPNV